jgi:hypothetical protein
LGDLDGLEPVGELVDGRGGGDDVRFAADKLGAQLVEQAKQAQETYRRIGDIIVSDYAKLSALGDHAGCNPNSDGCPRQYAFTETARVAFSTAFYRAVQRIAYEKLLPLGYWVYQLKNFDRLATVDRRRPPDVPNWFHCQAIHPFYAFPSLAYTSLLQILDPLNGINLYDVYLLSVPQGRFTLYGTPPPDTILHRMFDPVSTSTVPGDGGLGIPPDQLMRTAPHHIWNENDDPKLCWFG